MFILDSAINLGASAFSWVTGVVQAHPIPAALLTVFSLLSGMWNNHKNRQATIFGHSMQAITHLDQRWESEELKLCRSTAAGFLKRVIADKDAFATKTASEEESIKAVLNFLETVGCFVKEGAIAPRMSWQLFGSAVQYFVEASEVPLEAYRTPYATVYTEAQYLYHIARVEEDRKDLPGAWLWRRWSALKLTSKSKKSGGCSSDHWQWLWQGYAILLGKISVNRQLSPLSSTDEILRVLTAYCRSSPVKTRKVRSVQRSMSLNS